jgi:hypothetical protein
MKRMMGKEVTIGMNIPFMKHITWYLVAAMFIIGIAPRVDAGLAPSEIIAIAQGERNADLDKIRQALEIKAVSERLSQLGFSRDDIQSRLSQLNDDQVHQIALQLDDLRVGQSDALGVIIALLVIAILVVVLLKLTGHRVLVTR